MTIHLKDWHGAASLCYRNHCTEITVPMSEQKPYPMWFLCKEKSYRVYCRHSLNYNYSLQLVVKLYPQSHSRIEGQSGLDVATCGVANATRFYSLATNFSLLVARLAPRFFDLVLKFLIEFNTLILLCSCMKPMKSCSFDFGYFIYLLANAK